MVFIANFNLFYKTLSAELKIGLLRKVKKSTTNGDSDVWEQFYLLQKDDKIIPDIVVCNFCNFIRHYTSKMGTTNLRKSHHCSNEIRDFCQSKNIKFSPEIKKALLEAQTKHVCSGILPFRQAEDEGLIDLLKVFNKLGSIHGIFDPKLVLADRRAISKNTKELAAKIQNEYKEDLNSLKKLNSICLTTDAWSDSVNKNSFIDFTFTTLDESFVLKSFQYAMLHCNSSKTAEFLEDFYYT